MALREALQQHHGEVQRELVGRLGAQGRELPVAVALAVQQQMGRRDVATGALLGVAAVLVRGTRYCKVVKPRLRTVNRVVLRRVSKALYDTIALACRPFPK